MMATGFQPTRARSPSDVFVPSAAIAVTRHQREASCKPLATGWRQPARRIHGDECGKADEEHRQQRWPGLEPSDDAEPERCTTNETTRTTGSSMATRNSLTIVAVSPAAVETL